MKHANRVMLGAALLSLAAIITPLSAQRRGGIDSLGAPQGRGRGPLSAAAERVQTHSYRFTEANKKLDYALFVPSRYNKQTKSPLVIALHGRNAPPESLARSLADAAEAGGYIVAAPMGYSLEGWYGLSDRIPAGSKPANLAELSEKDVMNVLDLMHHDFTIDEHRIYLAGSSMGGAGALYLGTKYHQIWAAVGARDLVSG